MKLKWYWRISAIWSTTRSRGAWSGARLAYLLIKGPIKEWLGVYGKALGHIAMLALGVGSIGLVWQFAATKGVETAGEALAVPVGLAVAFAGIAIAVAHFILPATHRSQVVYRSLQAVLFASLVGGAAYLGHARWMSLYSTDPASATLWGLFVLAVLVGFFDVMGWFARSALIRDLYTGDVGSIASINAAGRWHIAIHEAGHAVCYGLCNSVPEDVYAGIDPDLLASHAGAVAFPQPKGFQEITSKRIEWMLMCTEAGAVAEEVFFGDRTPLGAGDSNQSGEVALVYLMAGLGEVVSNEPKTEPEIAANRAAIRRLRDKAQQRARILLEANKGAVERIATRLVEAEFIDSDELATLVKDIAIPEGMERISWPTDIPSHALP